MNQTRWGVNIHLVMEACVDIGDRLADCRDWWEFCLTSVGEYVPTFANPAGTYCSVFAIAAAMPGDHREEVQSQISAPMSCRCQHPGHQQDGSPASDVTHVDT
jgi:hypothetical protein